MFVDRTQPTDPGVCRRVADFRSDVRHREGEIQHALLQIIDRWLCRPAEDTLNRRECGTVPPRHHAAVGVQSGGQPVCTDCVHVVVPHVVFAGELDAHRRPKPP